MQTVRLLCIVCEAGCSCVTPPVSVQEIGIVQFLVLLKEQQHSGFSSVCVIFASQTTQKVTNVSLKSLLNGEKDYKKLEGRVS